jgi:hypothetical protein
MTDLDHIKSKIDIIEHYRTHRIEAHHFFFSHRRRDPWTQNCFLGPSPGTFTGLSRHHAPASK